MWKIKATPAAGRIGLLYGLRARVDMGAETVEVLVDQVLVILDDVAAAAGKGSRKRRQFLAGHTARLDGRGQERAAIHARQPAQALAAVDRPPPTGQQRARQLYLEQADSAVHGNIPVQ